MRPFALLVSVAGLFALAACAPPPVKSLRPAAGGAGQTELLEETWESVYVERAGEVEPSAKVGHTQTRVEKVTAGDRELRRITNEQDIKMFRYGQDTSFRQTFTADETPAGELLGFEFLMQAGSNEMTVRGTVAGNRLNMTFQTQGKSQSRQVDWDKSCGGTFAVARSLKEQPMKPGETRSVTALAPDLPFPAASQTRLEAVALATVELRGRRRELLQIKETTDLGEGKIIESVVWVDEQGEAIKSQLISGLPLTLYRTSKEEALRKPKGPKFDLGLVSTVKVARPPGNKRTVYRARLPAGEITNAFAAGATQSVRYVDKQTAEIVVRAITPDEPERLETPDASPADADREPNNLIQSDDQRVVALANSVARDETDPWKLAVALERHINQSIRSNFSMAFATAAETAESLEGDCTEHAMLLAAVCRARQLPARVAVGLVFDGKQGYAFHMWTEVWISDRWIPLDATRGEGGIGAEHLKLAQSNLQVSSITTALFPVFNVLGRLELEIVEAE